MVEVDEALYIVNIFEDLGRRGVFGAQTRRYGKLERTLLKFSRPELIWNVRGPLRLGRNSFWASEIEWQFPLLSLLGTVALKPAGGDL